MSQPLRRLVLLSFLLMPTIVLAAGAEGAAAPEGLEWSAGTGLTHYENINQVPDNGENDTAAAASAALKYDGAGTRHAEHVWAAATYYNYLDNTYHDQVLGGVAGDLTLQFVPEALSWIVEDNYGPVVRDPLESNTPDNRTYVNYFSTGPQITIGASRPTRMVFDARYSRSTYSDPLENPDSNQISGDLALVRQTSPGTEWSLHATGTHVSYFDNDAEDYDTYEGYLRYNGGSARTRITADAGYDRLEYAGDSQSTPLLALSVSHQLTKLTTFSLAYRRDYEDTVDNFVRLQDTGGAPNVGQENDVTTLANPLRQEYLLTALSVSGLRTTATLGGGYSDSKYEQSTSDLSKQKATDVYLLVTRQLNDFLSLTLRAADQRTKYETDANRKDTDDTYDAALTWKLGRALSLVFVVQYESRDSTDNSADYDTTIAGIWIGYSPGGQFRPGP